MEFKAIRFGEGWRAVEIMDCGGKGLGPDRNWRAVGASCDTQEAAEAVAQRWRDMTVGQYCLKLTGG